MVYPAIPIGPNGKDHVTPAMRGNRGGRIACPATQGVAANHRPAVNAGPYMPHNIQIVILINRFCAARSYQQVLYSTLLCYVLINTFLCRSNCSPSGRHGDWESPLLEVLEETPLNNTLSQRPPVMSSNYFN
jgi:hypothetical protein